MKLFWLLDFDNGECRVNIFDTYFDMEKFDVIPYIAVCETCPEWKYKSYDLDDLFENIYSHAGNDLYSVWEAQV